MTEIILSHSNNQVTADSRMVAEHFGREHRTVLASIDELVRGMQENMQTPQDYFIESHYIHEQNGQVYRFFMLTRDGFSLLVMGFTGREALEWKLKYIAAFNELEKAATKPMTQLEILAASAQALVDHDRRLSLVEHKQDAMIDALTAPAMMDWSADMNARINTICKNHNKNYQTYRHELYAKLEATGRCNLKARQARLKERMKQAGHKFKDIQAVTQIHVIADDPKLRAIFEGIIKTEQVKHLDGGKSA